MCRECGNTGKLTTPSGRKFDCVCRRPGNHVGHRRLARDIFCGVAKVCRRGGKPIWFDANRETEPRS